MFFQLQQILLQKYLDSVKTQNHSYPVFINNAGSGHNC